MAIKIKKVVVIITLKELSAANSREWDDFLIYFHGASESEHSRFTQVNFKVLS